VVTDFSLTPDKRKWFQPQRPLSQLIHFSRAGYLGSRTGTSGRLWGTSPICAISKCRSHAMASDAPKAESGSAAEVDGHRGDDRTAHAGDCGDHV